MFDVTCSVVTTTSDCRIAKSFVKVQGNSTEGYHVYKQLFSFNTFLKTLIKLFLKRDGGS